MSVIITGANGFIGSHLQEFLILEGESFLSSTREENRHKNKQVKYAEVDFSSDTDWMKTLTGVTSVIHLAGCAHTIRSKEEYVEINQLATENLVKQAANSGVKRFIFLSTALVHGETGVLNNDSNTSPKTAAAITKLSAENSIKSTCEQCDMEYVIIRSPLVYGQGVKANFSFLMNIVGKGVPLPFRAISNNKRSLISVYNLLDLITVCIDHPKAANQIFLASDDNDLSTAEMIALMAKVQGKANLSIPIPVSLFNLIGKLLNKQAVVNRLTGTLQLDIEHTQKTLNWQPPYSVEHGFKLAVKKS